MPRSAKTAVQMTQLWKMFFSFIVITYPKSISTYHNEVNFYAAISEHYLKNIKYGLMFFSWSKQFQGKSY